VSLLERLASHKNPVVRAWAGRLTGENREQPTTYATRTVTLAGDSDPSVRAAAAVAWRQLTVGSLTVDTEVPASIGNGLTLQFKELLSRPSVEGDFNYPHIVWMAMEPRVAANPQPFFPLLAANENSVSAYCARRVMRRICDLSDATARAQHLNAAMEWLGGLASKTELAGAALDGLIEAMKSKGAPPTIDLAPVFAKLNSNPALAEKARRLATLLGDTSASKALIAKINDARASLDERLKGIQAARETKDEASRSEVLKLMTSDRTEPLLLEGARSLSAFSGDEMAYALVDAWKNYSVPVRRAVADVLVTRSKWSRALLAGVERKAVAPQDISATARRALARADDKTIADNADRLLGRYRPTGADKLKLIADKRRIVLSGTPDLDNGHEVAKRTCFVCHKLYGEGADVGPDLTGVGRSTLDALLHNVIDPNEVIGNGFESTEVTLKDDSTVSGRVVEETDTRIKLIASGPMEHTIAKNEIKVLDGKPAIRKTELSLMPEGLEQVPDNDFRDLIMFVLNPPGDKRPWTPALRKELIGAEETRSAQR
jgi:putative heme-binding domain-containing protein